MEVTQNTYFKSLNPLDGDLVTMSRDSASSKRICQSLGDIITKKVIMPNTKHIHLNDRLCASVITNAYRGSYRPEGILFRTEQTPEYCSPVDIMALTDGETFTSSDCNSKFFGKSKELIFSSVDNMLLAYGSPEEAHEKLVEIRSSYGLGSPEKPFLYNECCFESPVKIVLVGLVGESDAIAKAARNSGLMVYPTIETFIKYNSDSLPKTDDYISLKPSANGELMRRMEEKEKKWDATFSTSFRK